MFRIAQQLSYTKQMPQLILFNKNIINQQRMNFIFKKDSDQPYTAKMLKGLEHSKSNIFEFRQQMDTWIKNVNNSEYLQQQLIADYYRQFAIVLHKRVKAFEDNELNYFFKKLNQDDLNNIKNICENKIKFMKDSINIRQQFFMTENMKKDQFKIYWWKFQMNKYDSSMKYKLIHYLPIYMLVAVVLVSILDLVLTTNSKRLHQIQQAFDSQLTQVKSIVDGIISDSQKNIDQNKPSTPQVQVAPIFELKQQAKANNTPSDQKDTK